MLAEAIAARVWPGRRALVEPLGGGITNHNFKVSLDGDAYVVRIGGERTELLGIDRHAEEHARPRGGRGSASGRRSSPSSTGRSSRASSTASQSRSRRCASRRRCARWRRCFAACTRARRSRRASTPSASSRPTATRPPSTAWRPAGYAGAKETADRIERRLGAQPAHPCHNDLLTANFIRSPDQGIRIVDWEYAGMGDRFFDLANFAVNNELATRRPRPARRVLRRGPTRARDAPDADALHVRLPRGDVGRRPAGGLGARLRLRRLRGAALRAPRAHRGRPRVPAGAGMKRSARVVVIGGGVGGCADRSTGSRSSAGTTSSLVERADLTSGSTFHSAGLVGQLRGSLSLTRMMMSSVELYRTLGEEVGLETGWHEVGSLRLASRAERMEELTPPGRLGEDVRAAARADLRRGGAAPLPADVDRRRARRRLPADATATSTRAS